MNLLDIYSLLVAIVATLFGMFSLLLTYIGYVKFKQADKLVEKKLNKKIKQFENDLDETLINIQSANAKINSCYQYFDSKDYDKVISILSEAEKIYPKAYNLYNTLGYAYHSKGDIISAELTFKKAILYHPKRVEGYNDLANLYIALNNRKKAEKIKKDALKQVPDCENLWQEL